MTWKILVADESDAIRSIAVNLFRQCGCELITASGGSEAWEILKSGKMDLAILNSDLSGMDGYTISKLVKEDAALAGTRTILMLSPSEIVNQHQLITAQPDATLSKPFAPPELLTKAGEVLKDDFQLPSDYDGHDLSRSVSEMELTEAEIAGAIDFGAIFEDDDNLTTAEDIHLTEVLGSSSEEITSRAGETIESLADDNTDLGGDDSLPDEQIKTEDTIRLADDQYGLEKPFDAPEVEKPHDYNWFIREMKNEIGGKNPAKKSEGEPITGVFPKKPDNEYTVDDMDKTGQFSISEIGSDNSLEPQTKPSAVDELDRMLTKASQNDQPKAALKANSTRLSLAEKLLVQELARRLAERIISQIPHEKLQKILEEVFEDLKKC